MRNGDKVSHFGLDNHRKFGRVTARDAESRVVLVGPPDLVEVKVADQRVRAEAA